MWTADIIISAGDRLPGIQATLRDANNSPIDLTGFTEARFILAESVGVTPLINSTVSAASTVGVTTYAWSTADITIEPGHYFWEFKLLDASGRWMTVPNGGYGTAEFVAALSTA